MTKKQIKKLKQIIIAIILLIVSILLPKFISNKFYNYFHINEEILEVLLSFIPYIYIGHDVLSRAVKKLKKRQAFDENFLMSLATVGAYVMGESHEAVMVMLLYQIGEFFQDLAVAKSRNNVTNIMSLRPTVAYKEKNNEIISVNPNEINIGEVIVVKVGDKIPLDGKIIYGESLLNTSIITGESVPRLVKIGDTVNAGMINESALLKIEVTKSYDDSTINKIIALIENAGTRKSISEKFISNFARVYTPAVCILALLVFLIPSIYSIFVKDYLSIKTWGYRALTSLVISCPCSILISIPLAFFALIGGVSKKGILIKSSNLVETLANVKEILLDKTGTMTKGVFEVVGIHKSQMNEEDILKYAAYAEYFSNHPIAKSIIKKYGQDIDSTKINNVKEIGGYGISANVYNKTVLIGNELLMKNKNILYQKCSSFGTIVHVAIDNIYVGHILVNDIIKEESKEAIEKIHKMGITTSMLTGDKKEVATTIAKLLNINNIYSELLPNDKLNIVDEKIKMQKNKVAFVGDGINDAPALRLADVGIAMGAIGSDEVIEVSDVIIMDDNPIKISLCIKYAKKCMAIVYENIIFSIVIKISFLVLSAMGISHMAFATFADVGVMIICVLNSIRLLFLK